MKEYYGKSANKYGMTKGKRFLLYSTINKLLPKTDKKQKLLDIACGTADFFELITKKGYTYYGVDSSEKMISIAKTRYHTGHYKIHTAIDLTSIYKIKFDVILISMLFPSLNNKKDIVSVIKEAKKLLKETGIIIIGVTHPCFDHYMQKKLFNRSDVTTSFLGYFKSGNGFTMRQYINKKKFIFEDFHWTLSDYIQIIIDAGLKIQNINECAADEQSSKYSLRWAKRRNICPTYLVLVLSKK